MGGHFSLKSKRNKGEKMKERMVNTGKRIWEDRKYQIIAFLVCLGSFYLYYSWMSLIRDSKDFLMIGDTFNLYIPATRQFFADLVAGENISFSWNNGFGMNTIPLYTSCVGGSIFSLFFLIFSNADPAIILTIVIGLKIAMAGACFVYFVEKGLKQRGIYTIAFALIYAMSGAQMTICIQNFLWMDAEYILPVLLVLIMDFFETKHWGKLLFTYAYLFICSYIAAYVVGFFSAIFFFIYLFGYVKKKYLITIIEYVGVVLGAAGLCAFALLPTAVFLLTKMAPDASSQTELELGFRQVLTSMAVGRTFEMDVQQPYYYVGMLSFVLQPFFFLSKRINKREKCVCGLLLLLLLLSSLIPGIYLFWHGFNAPDGWYYRFSYLVSFVVAAMACRVWGKEIEIKATKKVKEHLVAVIIVGMMTTTIIGLLMAENRGLLINKYSIVFSGLFVVIWLFFLYMDEKRRTLTNKNYLNIMVIVICTIEVVLNSCFYLPNKYSDKKYHNYLEVGENTSKMLEKDTDFYRVNFTNCRNWNWDSFFNIRGNSDFGTFENYEVRRCLEKLGAYTSPRLTCSYGQNPVTQLLLGVKYNIQGMDEYKTENNVSSEKALSKYEQYLGLGYMVRGEIEQYHLENDNIYENCNDLLYMMTGEEIEAFKEYDLGKVYITCTNAELQYIDNKYYFVVQEQNGGVGQITFFTEEVESGKKLFATFDCGWSLHRNEGAIIMKGTDEANDVGSLGVRYSNELRNKDGRYEVSLVTSAENMEQVEFIDDFYFYESDSKEIQKACDYLKENQLQIISMRNGYVEGNIQVEDPKDILFTTIPYDKGWKLQSDGQGVEMISLLDGAFIGVKFSTPGYYTLKWQYTVPGLKIGEIISLTSLLAIVLLNICIKNTKK